MIPFINLYNPLMMDVVGMDDTSSIEGEPAHLFNASSDESISEDTDSDGSEYIPENCNPISSSSRNNDFLQGAVISQPEPSVAANASSITPAPSVHQNVVVEHSEGASAMKSVSRDSGDDDGQICTICFEPWTNSSIHRLVSLRCGHLFGRSCITRWLKGQNPRCPQCNARARKSEIRNIYAKAVKVLDSTERDKAIEDLSNEMELRRKAEVESSQARLKHMLAVQECERLKRELVIKERIIQEYRLNVMPSNSNEAAKRSSPFFMELNIELSKAGGCRIIDSSDLLGIMLISQPSATPIFSGYGFRKVSYHDMKAGDFCSVHSKPIRDMAIHSTDALVLTASLDKTLRITNTLTNGPVQRYTLDSDVWSCAWDTDDPMYIYGGLRTGEVYVFDIRMTGRHVYQLPRFGAKTPVVSLQYLKSPAMSICPRKCGPIVGKLSDCALQQKTEIPDFYKIVSLPLLGPLTSLSSDPSGYFLVSSRPSLKQPRVNHTLCNFASMPNGDLLCNPITTVLGGKNQLQLTRSKLLSHPDNAASVLLCAGDEDQQGALIWDGSSGTRIQSLQTISPVLDFTGLRIDHRTILAALTSTNLRLYNWTADLK